MSAHKVKLKTNYVNWITSFIKPKLFMKSNMQIINVNAAIIMSCSHCDLVFPISVSSVT